MKVPVGMFDPRFGFLYFKYYSTPYNLSHVLFESRKPLLVTMNVLAHLLAKLNLSFIPPHQPHGFSLLLYLFRIRPPPSCCT